MAEVTRFIIINTSFFTDLMFIFLCIMMGNHTEATVVDIKSILQFIQIPFFFVIATTFAFFRLHKAWMDWKVSKYLYKEMKKKEEQELL